MKSVDKKEKVLFVCTQNSARSQMAEGILRNLFGERYEVYSAGTEPAGLNPYAAKVMAEIGIDISHHRSKNIVDFLNDSFDWIVTVCDHANETCPVFPGGGKRIHKGFTDPARHTETDEQMILSRFRKTRDEITGWIRGRFEKP